MKKPALFLVLLLISGVHRAGAQDRPSDFVDAATVVPGLMEDIRYAGSHNFVGRPVDGYETPRCLLARPAADALAQVARDLAPQGIHIKVFDCYRPARAVANFVRWARDLNDQKMKAEFYPNVDKRTLFSSGYISSRSTWVRRSISSARSHGPPIQASARRPVPTACCSPMP
jgi:D-alanyl-D-alanine dipeptidase